MKDLLETEFGGGEMFDKVVNELDQCFNYQHRVAQGKAHDCIDSRFLVQSILSLQVVGIFKYLQLVDERLAKSCVWEIPIRPSDDLTQVQCVVLDDSGSCL